MNTNTIIWVFGASAAGKETFIKNITNKKSEKILTELGLENNDLVACNESINWVGQFDNDPVTEKRKTLPDIVLSTLKNKNNTAIFIKGQFVDLENNTPIQLLEGAPDAFHRIVFLTTNTNELYTRVQRKAWWFPKNSPNDSIEKVEEWLHQQIELLNAMNTIIPVIAVDSTTADYYTTKLPPSFTSSK